jgi:guanine nucleotide-binding protein G(i) subunit alpha
VKQMKLIHQNGYNREELAKFKPVVYRNLIDSAQDLVRAMKHFNLAPVDPSNKVRLTFFDTNARV